MQKETATIDEARRYSTLHITASRLHDGKIQLMEFILSLKSGLMKHSSSPFYFRNKCYLLVRKAIGFRILRGTDVRQKGYPTDFWKRENNFVGRVYWTILSRNTDNVCLFRTAEDVLKDRDRCDVSLWRGL